ncbi:MAG: competence/damage-inducible protein A [Clostridia bacterium]
MKAEIICVGTELLLGDIVNTNATWLAKQLAEVGVSVYKHLVVGDNHKRLTQAIKNAIEENDVVICTGGLGPTQDDMTKEALAQACNVEMVQNEKALKWLEGRYDKSWGKMAPNNYRQTYFPKGSIPLNNPNGSAPGCRFDYNGKHIFLLPGPPREMNPMYFTYIKPFLEEENHVVLRSLNMKIIGIGESSAEEIIKDIVSTQTNPTIATYAHFGELTIRLTAMAETEQEAKELIVPVASELKRRFGNNIYGYDEDTIESVVIDLLKERDLTIAVAESCTGGLISSTLISVPGVSEVFKEAMVTYTNEAKIKHLKVDKEAIIEHGAVSEEVAKQMAIGIAKLSGADIGISTTGIAGPGGGTKEKPVGLVYVGLYYNDKVKADKYNINSSRDGVRRRTTLKLIDWVRRTIQNDKS